MCCMYVLVDCHSLNVSMHLGKDIELWKISDTILTCVAKRQPIRLTLKYCSAKLTPSCIKECFTVIGHKLQVRSIQNMCIFSYYSMFCSIWELIVVFLMMIINYSLQWVCFVHTFEYYTWIMWSQLFPSYST